MILNGERPIIVFLGKCGTGKTSSINALFNLNWDTDDAVACTKSIKSAHTDNEVFQTGFPRGFFVVDTPGIYEDESTNEYYFNEYRRIIIHAQHTIWVYQADTRGYRYDQEALLKFKHLIPEDALFTLGLNQIDLISPLNWNIDQNQPSLIQSVNIRERKIDIVKHFAEFIDITTDDIIAYSAIYFFANEKIYKCVFWRD